MSDDVVNLTRPGRHDRERGEVIHQTPGFPPMLSGMSTNDYTTLLLNERGKQRWNHEAKGKILMLPRTGMVIVPFEMTEAGWYVVSLYDPTGAYPPSGYNIFVGLAEIETARELSLDWASVKWA